jgi:hypothetical protein
MSFFINPHLTLLIFSTDNEGKVPPFEISFQYHHLPLLKVGQSLYKYVTSSWEKCGN